MKLFLIRHGETVDNVRQLYAGSRNSELTNHGVQQTQRLGKHFVDRSMKFSHIYASPLTRAFRTAEAITTSQSAAGSNVEFVVCPELVEQDFGSLEGVSWAKPPPDLGDDFVPAETRASLTDRCDKFLEKHIIPNLALEFQEPQQTVAVVSHGITLSNLWKRLHRHIVPERLNWSSEGNVDFIRDFQHLGSWSNTGYLELRLQRVVTTAAEASISWQTDRTRDELQTQVALPTTPAMTVEFPVQILACQIDNINCIAHLKGLQRTKGGIGSSAFDKSQTSINSFFKPP